MPIPDRRRFLLAAAAAAVSGGCATPTPLPTPLPAPLPAAMPSPLPARLRGPGVLLGEVHDNPAGHALRLALFDAWLAEGARPALAMEMLDHGDQPAIERLRGQGMDAAAFVDAVLAARPPEAGRGQWDWRFYTPFVERALRLGLPLVAANVGRVQARELMRSGLAAHGFDAEVAADIVAGQTRSIEASHCGHVDPALAGRMVLAQVARDQQMARAVQAHIGRGVLLIAGNGHVRSDLGVPRWLDAATRARCEAIGVLETGDDTAAFDRILRIARLDRVDPCSTMKPPAPPKT